MIKKIKFLSYRGRITNEKVYDVFRYIGDIQLSIIDDSYMERYFFLWDEDITFVDVTSEYRSGIIDEILE